MASMKHGLERHRGACSISESPAIRRKFAGPRKPAPSAMDAIRLREHEAENEAFQLFEAQLDCLVLKVIPIETLKRIHRAFHPKG